MPSLGIGPILGPSTSLASMSHRVEILNPEGPAMPDEGEYLQPYANDGYAYAAIEPATSQRQERFTRAGAIVSATHMVTTWFFPQITTRTRFTYYDGLLKKTRRLDVLGFASPRELGVQLVSVCQEIIP
jgi:head-tail adaptor